MRNKIWKGQTAPDWANFFALVNRTFFQYWQAVKAKLAQQSPHSSHQWIRQRKPPIQDEVKFNFDAAFKDGCTTTGVVLWNSTGAVLGAWIHHFVFDNAFRAETEAVVQALQIASELNIRKATFEGDVANVILALQGNSQFDDWCA